MKLVQTTGKRYHIQAVVIVTEEELNMMTQFQKTYDIDVVNNFLSGKTPKLDISSIWERASEIIALEPAIKQALSTFKGAATRLSNVLYPAKDEQAE